MGQNWDKFRLLMWKNWTLQYRKPLQTVIEILAPVLFSILLVLIRSLVDPEPHDAVEYHPFCTIPYPIPGFCELPTASNSTSQNNYRKLTQTRNYSNGDDSDGNIFK